MAVAPRLHSYFTRYCSNTKRQTAKMKRKQITNTEVDLERSLIDTFVLVTFLNSKMHNEKSKGRETHHNRWKFLELIFLILQINY